MKRKAPNTKEKNEQSPSAKDTIATVYNEEKLFISFYIENLMKGQPTNDLTIYGQTADDTDAWTLKQHKI